MEKKKKKSPETDLHIYDQLIFKKSTRKFNRKKKKSLQLMMLKPNFICNNRKITSIHISYQMQKINQNKSQIYTENLKL